MAVAQPGNELCQQGAVANGLQRQCLADDRHNHAGIDYVFKRHKANAVGVIAQQRMGGFNGQARLTNAGRADECCEPPAQAQSADHQG